jgi:hypothetical protein
MVGREIELDKPNGLYILRLRSGWHGREGTTNPNGVKAPHISVLLLVFRVFCHLGGGLFLF